MEKNPDLWWLNIDLPDWRDQVVLSVVRSAGCWILTTNRSIWRLSADLDGRGRAELIHNF